MARYFNEDDFETEVLQSDIPVLVDFYADWCGPCKMMSAAIEKLAVDYDGRIKIGKCNVDDNMSLAQELGVSSIPNLKIFVNGSEEESIVGVTTEKILREKLDEYCF